MSEDRFSVEVERLTAGRELSAVDRVAVEVFAGLSLRGRDARKALEDGLWSADGESGVGEMHPAVDVERKASAELRGWVKDRPDLFGASGVPAQNGRGKFAQSLRSVS